MQQYYYDTDNYVYESEADLRLKDLLKPVKKCINKPLMNLMIGAIDGLAKATNTRITVDHGDHHLNLMYEVVDSNKLSYDQFNHKHKRISAGFTYEKIPNRVHKPQYGLEIINQ